MGWLRELWRRQSLRARITLTSTALFAFAVVTGAVLLLALQRVSLIRALDSSARRAGDDVATLRAAGNTPPVILAGADQIQVVDTDDSVVAASPGADAVRPLLKPDELARRGTARPSR